MSLGIIGKAEDKARGCRTGTHHHPWSCFKQRWSHKVSKSILCSSAASTRRGSRQRPSLGNSVFYTSCTSARSSWHTLVSLTFSRPSSSSCFHQYRKVVLCATLPAATRGFQVLPQRAQPRAAQTHFLLRLGKMKWVLLLHWHMRNCLWWRDKRKESPFLLSLLCAADPASSARASTRTQCCRKRGGSPSPPPDPFWGRCSTTTWKISVCRTASGQHPFAHLPHACSILSRLSAAQASKWTSPPLSAFGCFCVTICWVSACTIFLKRFCTFAVPCLPRHHVTAEVSDLRT